MHRVVLPELAAVEGAVNAEEAEFAREEIGANLQPQRQMRDRAVADLEERDDALGRVYAQKVDGEEDRESDACEAGEQREEQPVADIGDEAALLPPRLALVAGRNPRQGRKACSHDGEIGQQPDKRVGTLLEDIMRDS